MARLRIRSATPDDLPAVVAIYNHHVLHTVATFDTEPRAADDFRDRLSGDPSCPFLVADRGDTVVGYAVAGWFRRRPAYAGTRETSIYLAEDAQGEGLGTLFYRSLLDRLDDAGVRTEVAVIARPNEASEALHRRLGFRLVGVLTDVGDKFGRLIDTAWYQRMAPHGP